MACSKEEIERKRLAALAALQKRQNKLEVPHKPINGLKFNNNEPSRSPLGPLRSPKYGGSTKTLHPYARPSGSEKVILVDKVVNGTMYLITEDRFEVLPSEFCTPLINIFKTIPSKNYDGKSKLWNFSIDDYEELISKVTPLAPHVVLGPIPHYVLKVLREPSMDPSNVDLTPVEYSLRSKLMPFQEEGARFGIAHRGRCMIADDMGLGKTFQALAIASYYRHNWPLLIVTTSSMRETWQSKIHELLPSVPLMNIVTLSTGKDTQMVADKQTEVVIVSYKITSMHTDLLKSKKFGVVIIDESHHLKSHKAQCTVALSSIARSSPRLILLSGTPALSRPAELFTQLALIDNKLFPSYTNYGKRYCNGKQTNFGWDMSGQSNLTELQIILHRKFLIRRTKEQVLTTLQQKTRETVLLDQSLLAFTKESESELSQAAETYKKTKSSEKHSALITYFSESAKAKIPAICKYVRHLLQDQSTGKFLLFAHHRNVVEAVCLTLDDCAVHYICIVGSTPAHTRADLVDKFQYVDSCRCAVLSTTAANAGLTLTAANLVIFAELHWNPGILTQAESRAHRMGQSGGVCVRYLLARGTADDHMWPMLQHKLDVLNNVGLSKDTFQDTTLKHQESKYNITQFLSPVRIQKNKNDYIPGTNIKKDSTDNKTNFRSQINETDSKSQSNVSSDVTINVSGTFSVASESNCDTSLENNISLTCDAVEKSFFEDNEDDKMLANFDL